MGRVRIGTCSGPADAALVRSVFSAHGIHVAIGAEEHASMLGGLGGGFLRLDISVDEADAEDAVALLDDIREGEHAAPADAHETAGDPDGTDEHWASERVEDHPEDGDDDDDADADEHARPPDAIAVRIDRRRRTVVAFLLAFCISFGTAHMFTRAWLRGMALAGIEALGISYLRVAPVPGGLMIAGAILVDAIGAVVRIWKSTPAAALPVARLRR